MSEEVLQQRVRAVLHHQAAGPGVRARAEPGLRRRQPVGRWRADRQRGRQGHHGERAVPARGQAAGCRCGSRPGAARTRAGARLAARHGIARILVVDDEAECRETVSAMLAANGFAVTAAQSGEAALRLVEQGLDFHLLLVDFTMPGMSGVELAQEVRARRPSVPVVFFTGGDGEWISGERWVLRKPFLSRSADRDVARRARPDAARPACARQAHRRRCEWLAYVAARLIQLAVRADRRQRRGVRHHAPAAGRRRAAAAGRPRDQRATAAAARAAWSGSAGMGAVRPLHARARCAATSASRSRATGRPWTTCWPRSR